MGFDILASPYTEVKADDSPLPVAITGDCLETTKNSATVSCTYENVPEGGVCGVEYTWSNGSKKQSVGNANGTQTIMISELESGTTYSYCAYIEVYGQTYYGEEKSFSTENEIPDITGIWHCIDYDMDGKVSGEATFELTKEGKVYRSDVSGSGGDCDDPGLWSIIENGWVHIVFEHVINIRGDAREKSYGGYINNFANPSTIEGTATNTYYGANGGFSQTKYSFVMSR